MISIFPVEGIPILKTEDDLWNSLKNGVQNIIQDEDIIVCAHTPFSRVSGPIYEISTVKPSERAIKIAEEINKDPKKIEVILQLSKEVVKVGRNVIITRNHADIVCANAGVDESNAGIGFALGLPEDPDALAMKVKKFIHDELGINIAVIISDTVGRALRKGAVNIAVGCAGLKAMKSEIGKKDLFGYEMRVSEIAIADEIASAAELVQGQTDEANPFVIVRGYPLDYPGSGIARSINRSEDERLFK